MTRGNPHVLVVDDEPHLCTALHRILEKEGYDVATASNGETALRLVAEKEPDVILLDLMMPGMDGREVCRRVRELSDKTRVIYFTAKAEPAGPERLKELRQEADGMIAKPATSRTIISRVDRAVRAAQGWSPEGTAPEQHTGTTAMPRRAATDERAENTE